ncbi:MAG: DUF1611 domain-containing protein [Planctomycetaceae bacterium]|nr:DUF1611 domain-containing protein [Planctomycetaceae bacterium]
MSLLRYRTGDVVAVIDREEAGKSAQQLLGSGGGIPVVGSLEEIPDVDSIYLGIAPPGGRLPEQWRELLMGALNRGLDLVSGLHDFLCDDIEYVTAAEKHGCLLIDVRRNGFRSTAKCHNFREGCVRVHTIGHDCSVGKMVTAIEVQQGLAEAGQDARFLATGQTGMMISGDGLPIDCVVSDFVNGAAEELCRSNEHHDFLLIEGQGTISHPSFSAVTVGLLHGSAPDGLIFCFEAGREQVKGLDGVLIPPLEQQLSAFEAMARLRHPCRTIGIAVNTRYLTSVDALAAIDAAEQRFGLPACDVYRTGAQKLVQACIHLRKELLNEME